MRKAMLVVTLAAVFCTAARAQEDPGWPRQITHQGNTLVYYQPQVDDWQNFTDLHFRMAISLTPAGGEAAIGVVQLQATTSVDTDNHLVTLIGLNLEHANFPSLDPASAEQMSQLVRSFLPPTVTMSLARLVACVPKKESYRAIQLKNDPPMIFVSFRPAILLDVDGQPVRAAVPNTQLEFVVNTHWALFFDKSSSQYYLLAGQLWMKGPGLDGPWSVTPKLPKEMTKLSNDSHWSFLKDSIPPPPSNPNAAIPMVIYSTAPSEIILFNGAPVYSKIPGTSLTYATNTRNYVFVYGPTNQYYYLTAGRWFRANSLEGPWTFATPDLPADFAHIPPASPAAQVLASVPGTEEAKDAVLMSEIPTTVTVNPTAAAAQARVSYDGAPQFAPIQGTTLYYATNTSDKVIQFGTDYYLCLQGVWFVSTTPQGPWITALTVPQVIYTIPPSSPVYNVTYVTQVTTSSGDVQASYTAGYMGAFVVGMAAGAVIAGGTGYYYPPYIGVYPAYGYPHYYPTPYTYGAGAYYNSRTGAYGVSQTAYGPYGSATRSASYNPYTGTYARSGSVSTPYGRASAGQAYNPYTGAYGATKQGSNAYSQWGSSVVTKGNQSAYAQHYSTAQGTVGSVQGSNGARAAGSSTAYGNGAAGKSSNGDLYAGHDGNVYKNTGSGWQKYNGSGSWDTVNKPTPATAQQQYEQQRPVGQSTQYSGQANSQQHTQSYQQQHPSSSQYSRAGSDQIQGLQSEAQNRQRGTLSTQRFQESQRFSGGRRRP